MHHRGTHTRLRVALQRRSSLQGAPLLLFYFVVPHDMFSPYETHYRSETRLFFQSNYMYMYMYDPPVSVFTGYPCRARTQARRRSAALEVPNAPSTPHHNALCLVKKLEGSASQLL